MPFNPALPADNTLCDAPEMRAQLNALKGLIDGLSAQLGTLSSIVPIGVVLPWFKDTPGVPALPDNFVECNGQPLDDSDSPLDGQMLPDLNTGQGRFLRGALNSGGIGGIDSFGTAQADNAGVGTPQNFVTTDFSPGAMPFPPYTTVVWVMRVK